MQVAWLAVGIAMTLTACSSGDELRQAEPDSSPTSAQHSSGVPEEFRPACGRPGTEVVTERLDVTVKHRDCDLTGVTIVNQGRGAVVPEPGFGVGNSSGVTIEVDETTRDVTFKAEAEVAQY